MAKCLSRQIDNSTLRYFCYFLSGGGLAAGEGKVMAIQMKPKGESVPVGTYTVTVKDIKLGTSELADKYAGADSESSFNVSVVSKGDANGDGEVDAKDIVDITNYMMSKPTSTGKFNKKAADVNEDGVVNIADVVAISNIIMKK